MIQTLAKKVAFHFSLLVIIFGYFIYRYEQPEV
jgi:hypothetical protein